VLPPLLARWTEALLGELPAPEGEAVCERCVMRAAPGAPTQPGDIHFGDWKCCTYQPRVHNFLAGRILGGVEPTHPSARDSLLGLIARRAGVSPLGVYGPRTYWLVYEAAPSAFGRATALRCPLFDSSSGGCGVWAHREATCATWFCKHDQGAKGKAFWDALRDLLVALERAVAKALVMELDPGPEALEWAFSQPGEPLDAEEVSGGASESSFQRRWGCWLGREVEFFEACAARADAMPAEEVLALAGVEGRALVRILLERWKDLRPRRPRPERLLLGRFEVIRLAGDHARLSTYSPFDPLEIPRGVLGALTRFDGRPTPAVLAEVAREEGLAIPESFLDTLLDFGVLVEAKDP